MRKQLLVLSLFATLLFPVSAFAQAPAAEPIQVNPGDKLHLCIKGEADAALFHPLEEGSDKGVIMTLEGAGTDLFQARQRLIIANGGKSDEVTLRNKENGPYFTNASLVYIQDDYDLLSQNKILNVFDRHQGFDPYIDYETPNSGHIPCETSASNALMSSVYKIKAESFLLHVTEIHAPALPTVPADIQPVPPPAVVQPSPAPAPAPATPDGVSGGSFGDNPAPQSGGCNMSMALGGFNYGLSILFSLVLGAHAVLRFRKK